MIKIIAAVSQNGVIGKNNDLPWGKDKYPEDMKFFRQMTANSIVIMGRRTFESMGSKPLPKRENILISRKVDERLHTFTSLDKAISEYNTEDCQWDIWLIGGAGIYREGMKFAHEIYLTLIPEEVHGDGLIYFPWIDPSKFTLAGLQKLENSELFNAKYVSNKLLTIRI